MKTSHIIKNGFCLIFYLAAGCVSMSACKKFVQIGPPTTELVTASVFNNSATATSALTSIYSQMASNGESFIMAQYSGLLADELRDYSTNKNLVGYYTNSMYASTTTPFGRWQNFYNYIYQADAILSALQNNQNINQAIEQQLIGESRFIRAFCLFYLTNCYGSVPIVTSTDYTINASIGSSSSTAVYAQIIGDLKAANQLLNSNYVDISDTTTTTERTRPNKAAAEALLARVYLYTSKYDSAVFYSSQVIGNSAYQLCTNLSPLMGGNSVFLMNSSEAIFQFATPLPTNNQNTTDAQGFILQGAPLSGSVTAKCTTISQQLLTAFEPGDLRRSNWIGSTATTPAYYFPYKYQAYNTSTITEYVMVLRLAEQYLIRAEAETQLNDLTDATTDLNKIRQRAGLANISNSISSSQSAMLGAIAHERQVELFTEWGHRWFDLIRTNAIDTVMGSPGNVYNFKGGTGTWNSDLELYPISAAQIELDPNLVQNSGY
jgi:starch-binding outer membrane protein, SusD/RagB family